MAVKKEKLHAKGLEIAIYTEDFRDEYISLTDIAKYRNADDPRFIMQNWMRSRDVLEFLGIWELLHNPDFNRVNSEAVKNEAGYNRFVIKANTHNQYNTLSVNYLVGGGIASQIIHSIYSYKTCSDAFAKCMIVLLNLPKACVHVRTHGKTVSWLIAFFRHDSA